MSSSLYFPALGPDSILVPDGLSPSTTLSLDDFSRDPGFLASQEELRSLIFNTAQSAAPSREGSPLERSRGSTAGPVQQIEQILSRGRNLEYLRNYSSQVAPWVIALFSLWALILMILFSARHVRQQSRLWYSTLDICSKCTGSPLRSACSVGTSFGAKRRDQDFL